MALTCFEIKFVDFESSLPRIEDAESTALEGFKVFDEIESVLDWDIGDMDSPFPFEPPAFEPLAFEFPLFSLFFLVLLSRIPSSFGEGSIMVVR